VTPDASELAFKITGTTISPVDAGSQVVLTDQAWQVTVPASVLQTGINLGLLQPGDNLPVEVTAAIFASNTKEGTRTSDPTAFTAGPIEVSDGAAQPLTTGFAIDDMSWTAVGGTVGFSMGETVMNIAVGPLEVIFTCGPKDPSVTIVEAAVIGETDIPPAGRDGTEVKGETVEPADDTLPKTGANPVVPIALAVGLIDIGYLLVSAVRPARRRYRYLVQQ
jgi:hypothetical protein